MLPTLVSRQTALTAVLAVLSVFAHPVDAAEPTTDRLVVKLRSSDRVVAQGVREARVQAMSARARVALTELRAMAGGSIVYRAGRALTLAEARLAAMRIAADPDVEYAVPDGRVHVAAAFDDPNLGYQWSLGPVGAGAPGAADFATAWSYGQGRDVVVAVVDTGAVSHADLSPHELAGYDFVSAGGAGDFGSAGDGDGRDADPSDPGDYCAALGTSSSWHGLMVGSQIAAVAGNGLGIAGAAPLARVLMVRALGRCGGYESDVADAVTWAVGGTVPGVPANPTPARIVNLSLGGRPGTACPAFMQAAIQAALSRDALVVAAAGNDASTSLGSPATCTGVIVVGAHNRSGDLAGYSNRGAGVTLTGPGGGSCAFLPSGSCLADPTYALGNSGVSVPGTNLNLTFFNGTSAATPHVSAALANLLSMRPELGAAQAAAQLLAHGVAPHPDGTYCRLHAARCGAGMLDAGALMRGAAQPTAVVDYPAVVKDRAGVTMSVTVTPAGSYAYQWRFVHGPVAPALGLATTAHASFVPAAGGLYTFEVTVKRGDGTTVVQRQFDIKVVSVPVVSVPDITHVVDGRALRRELPVYDADDDPVTVHLLEAPAGMAVRDDVRMLEWAEPQVGTHAVRVQAEDATGELSAVDTFTVTVLPAGTTVATPGPAGVDRGTAGASGAAAEAGAGSGGGGGGLGPWDLVLALGWLAALVSARGSRAGTR